MIKANKYGIAKQTLIYLKPSEQILVCINSNHVVRIWNENTLTELSCMRIPVYSKTFIFNWEIGKLKQYPLLE